MWRNSLQGSSVYRKPPNKCEGNSASCSRKGDLAVVNDSDGGGRCCSARKRFFQQRYFVSDPTRSVSLCDMAAFLYALLQKNSVRFGRSGRKCLRGCLSEFTFLASLIIPQALKGEMAV